MKKPSKVRTRVVISNERMRAKLAECEFFLERMNQSADPQVFGYHLSAFLSALSALTILGLMRNHGQSIKRALEQLRKGSTELDFLLNSRDVEVHREGVRIWLLRSDSLLEQRIKKAREMRDVRTKCRDLIKKLEAKKEINTGVKILIYASSLFFGLFEAYRHTCH